MIVTIMQPAYLPWLGFFERILYSDILVVLDNVQLDGNSKTNFTNRNSIRTPQDSLLLTVPIKKKGTYGNLVINQIEISNESNWKKKHWDSIKQFYAKAPFFKHHSAFFESIYLKDYTLLVDLIKDINEYLFIQLNVKSKIIYSSSLSNIKSAKDDLILDICLELNADTYISGPFGRDYLNEENFHKKNIKILYHDYEATEYKQVFSGFKSNLSVIDLLFNCGPDSRKKIMSGALSQVIKQEDNDKLSTFNFINKESAKKLDIQILIDNSTSWIIPFAEKLEMLISKQNTCAFITEVDKIKKGDMLFLLSCEKKISKEIRSLNKYNFVVHESDLPQGKGFSPLSWQIIEGRNEIKITLFEAEEKFDSGNIFGQKNIQFTGTELLDELRHKQGMATIELVMELITMYPDINGKSQFGQSSYYRRRTPTDSELNIDKSIKEQFDLLRTVDNKRYPAFFVYQGIKYVLKIEKELI